MAVVLEPPVGGDNSCDTDAAPGRQRPHARYAFTGSVYAVGDLACQFGGDLLIQGAQLESPAMQIARYSMDTDLFHHDLYRFNNLYLNLYQYVAQR